VKGTKNIQKREEKRENKKQNTWTARRCCTFLGLCTGAAKVARLQVWVTADNGCDLSSSHTATLIALSELLFVCCLLAIREGVQHSPGAVCFSFLADALLLVSLY